MGLKKELDSLSYNLKEMLVVVNENMNTVHEVFERHGDRLSLMDRKEHKKIPIEFDAVRKTLHIWEIVKERGKFGGHIA